MNIYYLNRRIYLVLLSVCKSNFIPVESRKEKDDGEKDGRNIGRKKKEIQCQKCSWKKCSWKKTAATIGKIGVVKIGVAFKKYDVKDNDGKENANDGIYANGIHEEHGINPVKGESYGEYFSRNGLCGLVWSLSTIETRMGENEARVKSNA